MKKEIEKKIDHYLSPPIISAPKLKQKYKPSPEKIKALEMAFEKKADQQQQLPHGLTRI